MTHTTRTVLTLAAIFLLGYATAHWHTPAPRAQAAAPAYVIISGEWVEPDKLGPYVEAAQPLASKAGMQVLGMGETGSTIRLVEGDWPFKGRVLLEKYDSMDSFLDFWNSPGYQKAKKLREGLIKANFVIAIEGAN